MARIARRRVLTLSASGGMAAILASGRAPASPMTTLGCMSQCMSAPQRERPEQEHQRDDHGRRE